ncbi:amino acid ABC transporter ATP-binding protein [Bacillus atrophaeus]|uniref:amino acid ABC transporter ATP-binding protein n=1 Tax=Bacillus atrophaeus TaxID=1452 RepID=UPI00228300A2|nr:amino acid ABC transporter ATP-binding protein [Bacillus atrophaeus]MCY8827021.1 amino acid ABC transporter ATP-binding protein [Bacillus atrophaeus]MCY8842807.1 amino acid ABC transporter ATP-binding protein [Bacillus atrophaeus]MEC0806258.1 amino acid ABC transporter ATP-binding protein [Bacillus atrophaeus]MEC0853882.1 amino acid ABC transporter ATP-binding protein [Bacillus atrophaeus]MEC0857137.1 amino acid ABC transporter ATP-binding protein [Bacillus atrophaeus]
MIQVKNIRKAFKDLVVLDGIDLEVKRGEVVAIIGPSGSGKSTLLRCLNLLERPDQGLIEIGEAKLNAEKYTRKEAHQLRQQTAMVFQNYNLFKNKTALQNITEALIVSQKKSREEANRIGMDILKQVGLEHKANSYPITMSGGQQQRIGIARALAVNPHAILLDEPTSALDPELVAGVLQVIQSIAEKQTTMIIVTHEMAFAREVADKVIFMADGHIIEQGTPEELFDHPKSERTKRFIKQVGEAPELI